MLTLLVLTFFEGSRMIWVMKTIKMISRHLLTRRMLLYDAELGDEEPRIWLTQHHDMLP